MTKFVDKLFFDDLSEAEPKDVCRRALCRYDDLKRCYTISVWGDKYAVYPHECKIIPMGESRENHHEYLYLFMIHYLLKSKEIKINNQWISEKDVPGGPTFFRGPHEIPTQLITGRYGNDVEKFHKRCRVLHGTPLGLADASYSFTITDRIPVCVLYWQGDDLFPPDSKILYDNTITEHAALDIIFALAVGVCRKLGMSVA